MPQEKNLGGRPEKPIDYDRLKKLCSIHCTGEECAAVLDCSYEHLNNKLISDGHGGFLEYFKKHSASGKMSLRRKQFESALSGNVTMMVWLGKQYLDQSDRQALNHQSTDGTMTPKASSVIVTSQDVESIISKI